MKSRIPLLLLLLPVAGAGQITDSRLPISLDAESTDYDGKTDMLVFEGLKLTQGATRIEADRGRTSDLKFVDSVWRFAGNVFIEVEGGQITCDTADLRFEQNELRFATITGSPATYELQREGSDEVTYAEAGRLEYDLAAGTVQFSGNAVITEGGNRISSNLLVYNIVERRVKAESAPDGSGKVKITYTPEEAGQGEPGAADAATQDTAQGEPGEAPADEDPPQ